MAWNAKNCTLSQAIPLDYHVIYRKLVNMGVKAACLFRLLYDINVTKLESN